MRPTAAQAVVGAAFDARRQWRLHAQRPSKVQLDNIFGALDLVFNALSQTKQDQFLPPKPRKRGRKRTPFEFYIGSFLDSAVKSGAQWRDAVKGTQEEFTREGLDFPIIDDSTLRRILKRDRRKQIRPRLLPSVERNLTQK